MNKPEITIHPKTWEAIANTPNEVKATVAFGEALVWVSDQNSNALAESIQNGSTGALTMKDLFAFCKRNRISTNTLETICKVYDQPIPRIGLAFAFDYDGCANVDVDTFRKTIASLQEAGHKVYIVTMRYPSECRQVIEDFGVYADGIVPTSRNSKRSACESLGLKIDVWMDDNPRAIEESALQIWGTRTEEGTIHAVDHATGDPCESKVVPLHDFSALMVPSFKVGPQSKSEFILDTAYLVHYKGNTTVKSGSSQVIAENLTRTRQAALNFLQTGGSLYYTVQLHDTLSNIAEMFDTTAEHLSTVNRVTNPTVILASFRLTIEKPCS